MRLPGRIELAAYVVAALGVVLLLVVVATWKKQAESLPALRAELRQIQDDFAAYRTKADADLILARKVSNAYQSDLVAIRAAGAATPTRVVRLCPKPAPAIPADAGAAPGLDEPGAQDGPGAARPDPWSRAGRDIGPELYGFADDCAANAAQLTRLQEWIRAALMAAETFEDPRERAAALTQWMSAAVEEPAG
jgi:hypothetical protein